MKNRGVSLLQQGHYERGLNLHYSQTLAKQQSVSMRAVLSE